jgi:hypothetical protein
MNICFAFMALRSFIIVTPETVDDEPAAALLNQQLRQVVRAHREETFGLLSLSSFMRGQKSQHGALRRQASKLLDQASNAYDELDVEGAITALRQALKVAGQALASSKGTATWLNIRLQLGLRLWETDDATGAELVAQTLALSPKQKLPKGTQLSETMGLAVAKMRRAGDAGKRLNFTADSNMSVHVSGRSCITPCSIQGLPSGMIPWRATGPGIMTLGGVAKAGETVQLKPQRLPKLDAFVLGLNPLWTLEPKEADRLLSEQDERFRSSHLLWLRVGRKRLSMLRGQLAPAGSLSYRQAKRTSQPMDEQTLLDWLQMSRGTDAKVGPAIQSEGPLGKLVRWLSEHRPSLPSFSFRPSKRTLIISGATLVTGAAIAGLAYGLSQSPDTPSPRTYDPVLGY